VSPLGTAKPLVDEAIDQDPHRPPRGSEAFLPCLTAVVAPDARLHGRDDRLDAPSVRSAGRPGKAQRVAIPETGLMVSGLWVDVACYGSA
jgi:hypothetical protein